MGWIDDVRALPKLDPAKVSDQRTAALMILGALVACKDAEGVNGKSPDLEEVFNEAWQEARRLLDVIHHRAGPAHLAPRASKETPHGARIWAWGQKVRHWKDHAADKPTKPGAAPGTTVAKLAGGHYFPTREAAEVDMRAHGFTYWSADVWDEPESNRADPVSTHPAPQANKEAL